MNNFFNQKDTNNQLAGQEYEKLRQKSFGLCNKIKDSLKLDENDFVLDLGCGPGNHTILLSTIFGHNLYGLDKDSERIKYAQTRSDRIKWMIGDASKTKFDENMFDAVLAMFAFHRFSDQLAVLREIHRILKVNGRVAIVTLSREQLKERCELSFFPRSLEFELNRFPAIDDILVKVQQAGFEKIEVLKYSEDGQKYDETFISWVKEKPYCSLRQLTLNEFSVGIEQLSEHVTKKYGKTSTNSATIIHGMKTNT